MACSICEAASASTSATMSAPVWKTSRWGSSVAAALAALYGFLYLLLRLEDYALLAGAIAEPSISDSDWVAKMTEAFFLRSVFSHSRNCPAKP